MASRRAARQLVKHGRTAAQHAARFAPAPGDLPGVGRGGDAAGATAGATVRAKLGRPGVWEVDRGAGRAAADLAARRALWTLFAPPPPPLVPTPFAPCSADERPFEPVALLLPRLRAHAAAAADPTALAAAIDDGLSVPGGPSADANRRAVHALCEAAGGSLDAAALLTFAPFWVREPAAFTPPPQDEPRDEPRDPQGLGPRVVAHLFGRYAIPAVLAPSFAWSPAERPEATTWMRWAVALGAGAGLRDAGRALGPTYGWDAPGRFQAHFERAGARVGRYPGGPLAAAVRAEVARGGVEPEVAEAVARRLMSVRFYRLDPTAVPRDERARTRRAFWAAAVGWLAGRGAALSDPDARDVLTWAAGRFEADGFGVPGGFVWRGRSAAGTLAAVRAEAARKAAEAAAERARRQAEARRARHVARRAARAAVEEIRRAAARRDELRRLPGAAAVWSPHGWNWEWAARGSKWTVTELTSAAALLSEGDAMQHCVAEHAARCEAGFSAVYSLRLNGERRLTISLCPSTGELREVRGMRNRPPMPEESDVVARWVRRFRRPAVVRRHG